MDRIPDSEIDEILALDELRIAGKGEGWEELSLWTKARKMAAIIRQWYPIIKALEEPSRGDKPSDRLRRMQSRIKMIVDIDEYYTLLREVEGLERAVEQQYAARAATVNALENPTDEMVEKVAEAIEPNWFIGVLDGEVLISNFPGQTDQMQNTARRRARAAIKAMGEAL